MKAFYWTIGGILLLVVVLLSLATEPGAQADEVVHFSTSSADTFSASDEGGRFFGFVTITASGGPVTYRIFGPTFSSTRAGSLASGETANINLYEAGRSFESFAVYPSAATARGFAY